MQTSGEGMGGVNVTVVRFQSDGLASTASMLDTGTGAMPSLSQVSSSFGHCNIWYCSIDRTVVNNAIV